MDSEKCRIIEKETTKHVFDMLGTYLTFAQIAAVAGTYSLFHDKPHIHVWVALMVVVLSGNFLLAFLYNQRRPNTLTALRKWRRALTVQAFFVGLAWSYLWTLFELSNLFEMYLGLVGLFFLVLNSTITLGLRPEINIAAMLSPVIVSGFVYTNSGHIELFFTLCCSTLLANLGYSRLHNRLFIDSVLLRMANAELNAKYLKEKKEAESASNAKTRFLAAASHDLRQPLQSITLLTSALGHRVKDAKSKDVLVKLESAISSLGELLNSLLDISKLDANIIEPKLEEMSLDNFLLRICAKYTPITNDKGLSLEFVGEESVYIYSDINLLERIFNNLLDNAVRYTHAGGISITLRREYDKAIIQVIDTGIGIEKCEIDKVFSEFYQVDNPERDRRKGLGLGLSIVKRLSTLLGINIKIESEFGKGTEITLTMDCLVNQITKKGDSKSQTSNVRRYSGTVLVVDDERDVRTSMELVLEAWGFNCISAASMEDVKNKLKGTQPLDVLIVDYRLHNNVTGVDVANMVVRELGYHETPVLIISGDTNPERLQSIENSGFTWMSKPVKPEKVKEFIVSAITQRKQHK